MFEFVAQWKWQPNMKNFLAGKFFSRFSRWPYHSRIGEVAKTENWFNSSSKPVRVAPPPPLANPPPPPHFKPTHRKTRLGQRQRLQIQLRSRVGPSLACFLFSVFGLSLVLGFFLFGFLGRSCWVQSWSVESKFLGERPPLLCILLAVFASIFYQLFDVWFVLHTRMLIFRLPLAGFPTEFWILASSALLVPAIFCSFFFFFEVRLHFVYVHFNHVIPAVNIYFCGSLSWVALLALCNSRSVL